MKTNLQKLLFTIVCLLCSIGVYAHDFEVDGIYYNKLSSTEVEVTFRGGNYDSYDEYTGTVEIPESVTYDGTNYSVTEIGNYAFNECTGLTEVTIPNSVTEIGKSAFLNCTGLTKVTIGNSVTSIGDYAFNGCTRLTEVTIANSVTSIGSSAFSGCTRLTEVTIPNSVTEIGSRAFEFCTGLTKVTIGNSVTLIGNNAFNGCTRLTEVTIGNSVTSIGDSAFSGCTGLTEVTIPNSVTSIDYRAFSGCTGLTEVTIGNSVTEIGNNAFDGCDGLTTVNFNAENCRIKIGRWGSSSLFINQTYLFTINIGEKVTTIPSNTFSNYNFGLTTIYCQATTPPTISENSFNIYDAILYVPNQSVSAYKTAEYWKNFTIERIPDYFVDGLYYNILSTTDVEVTYKDNNYNSYSGTINIPETIEVEGVTYNITSISSSAFNGCAELTEVTIGNNVTSIGESTFENCTGLKAVTIGNSVSSIGNNAFYYCTGLTEITIPNSVTEIGSSAFNGCAELTEVTIGNSVSSIGNNAFYYCTGLTEITIPNSVTEIGSSAFNGCAELTEVTIGNNVTSIGESTFENCTGLKAVTIGNSVSSIGNNAFYYCTGLTEITIPNSVTEIGSSAFNGCAELTEVTIGNSVSSIGNNAFYYCTGLTEITIPNSVTEIGSSAFNHCTGLTEVTIGNSVTSIGEGAFFNCYNLITVYCHATTPPAISSNTFNFYPATLYVPNQSVSAYKTAEYWKNLTIERIPDYFVDGLYYNILSTTEVEVTYKDNNYNSYSGIINIPETIEVEGVTYNVASIGDNAFYSCIGLTEITIPNSVISIGNSSFYNCTGLTEITISNSATSMGNAAFEGCSGLTDITIPESVTSIGKRAFYYCTGLTEITIPESVTSIGESAFYNCTGLTEITIPNSVTLIDESTFCNCSGLTEITIPNSVTSIGDRAFYGCTGLTEITIPESVTSIGESAFYGCTGLTEITIPESVTSIGESAFSYCSGLTEIIIPNSVTSISDYAFSGCARLTAVTIPNSITSISAYTFSDCYSLTEITIPNSVSSIGEGAFEFCIGLTVVNFNAENCTFMGDSSNPVFKECENLATINIGDMVRKIPNSVFSGCAGLIEITIPENVVSIGEGAFGNCIGLTVVNFNAENCTFMGDSSNPVFKECENLTTINIGDMVRKIPNSAFSGCTGLIEITIPNNIEAIGNYAFAGCSQIETITIGSGVTQIEEHAFTTGSSIRTITVHAMQPPVLTSKTVFDDDAYDYAQLMVPHSCKSAYKDADHWYRFDNISEMESDNHFTVPEVKASKGSKFTLPIALSNIVDISGLQFDIYLPSGVNLQKGNEEKSLILTSRATSSHVVTAATQSDGAIRIIIYSNEAQAFEGNEGEILNITLEIASNFNGECKIELKNATMTAPDNSVYSVSDLAFIVELIAPEKGDANSDGLVNIVDINAVANYILHNETSQINITQADVANNGKINVNDLVGIANIILGDKPHTNAQQRVATQYAANDNRFYIENFNIAAGEEKVVAIMLDNSTMFSAFQTDIYLPEGLTIKQVDNKYDITLSNRKSNHIISSAKQKDGAIRILAYSASSEDFSGNSDELVLMTIVAANDFDKGDIPVVNTIFSKNDMSEYLLKNEYAAVNGGNAVESIEVDNWYISVSNGTITVCAAEGDTVVRIYNMSGVLLYNDIVENTSNINLTPGIYLVQVGNTVRKVVL